MIKKDKNQKKSYKSQESVVQTMEFDAGVVSEVNYPEFVVIKK
jgi:hypothetical protein